MNYLKRKLLLSDKGAEDLKKAVIACTLTNLSLLLPVMVSVELFSELLKPLMGQEISWTMMWILFGVGIVSALIVFLAAKNDYRKTYLASYKEAGNTRLRIAEHLRKLPMSFFNRKDLSELTTNMMADCGSMESMLSSTIPPLLANCFSITLTCILMAFFDWRMALAIFCSLPITFLIICAGRNLQERLFDRQVEVRLSASNQIQEYMEGIKVIKSCGMKGAKFSTMEHALRAMKKIAIKVELVSGILVQGACMVLQSSLGVAIFAGAVLITRDEIELLPLLVFFLIAMRLYGPVLSCLSQLTTLLHLKTVTGRMRTLLTTQEMQGKEHKITNFDIKLDHVFFGYNETDVIHDISCYIPTGSVTALVGPSGSGKSTLAKLVARFWDVRKGCIRIGNIDISTVDPEYLMKNMSFVFQDVTLFNDTVFNNIRIGNLSATEEQVMAAARSAYCDEFVQRLSDGYQTILGENGNTLSGGERQRISIARALLKNAPVILLDEATASLDPENEVLIQRAIAKLTEGKTVIMIAHRLRTVVDSDQILVLKDGRLVEQGTHKQLMKNKGLYENLYHIQKESLNWTV